MARTKKNSDYNDFLNRVNGNTTSWSNKYQNGNSKSTSSNNNIFNNYTSSNSRNSYDVDFNTFYNRVNGSAKSWYEEYEIPRQQEEYKKKYREEIEKETTARKQYYEINKEELKAKNTNDLIYNWNVNRDESGYVVYDYGNMPVRDKNGYAKKVDSKGNVYWLDLNTNQLYDNKYKLTNKDEAFINSLKYEYDTNGGNVVKGSLLNKADRVGLKTIDKSQYEFLINKEKEENKKNEEEWNNKYSVIQERQEAMYNESRKGIKTTSYGEGLNKQVEENTKKQIVTQNPYTNKKSIYEEQFDKLNEAIEKGQYTKANNALQIINQKYFGYSYSDGIINALSSTGNKEAITNLSQRFNNNVKKLEVINNSLKTVKDEETLNALNEEKNKLEFENQLIQYNKIYSVNSDIQLIDRMDEIYDPVYDTFDKVGQLWSNTFSEFDDGYDFGDLFKTTKKTINNTFQSIGATGKMINAGFQFGENMIISDMDEGAFKETWAPAIMDVATYMIPYVGQARIYINYMEPGSVIGAGILREGSATIDSADGSIRTPDFKNIIGAGVNIGMNYFSDYIFKGMRGEVSGKIGNKAMLELERKFYENSARQILANMAIHGSEEAVEEFVQTYAEYMQNMEGDLTWEFFKEHTDEALKSAFIAFVTASGASGVSSTINNIKLGNAASWYDAHGNYIGPGAEKIGKGQKYATVEDYFKAVKTGTENMLDTEYYNGAENIRINDDIANETPKTPYVSNDTKEYEDLNYTSDYNEDIVIENDEDAAINIAERLQNDEVITILDNDVLKTDRNTDLNLEIENDNNSNLTISDRVLYDNSKITIVPSKEMETYLKGLENYNGNPIYVADPKSPTFMDDVRNYVNEIGKSNIVVKNNQDFNPNEYILTPQEMNDINKMVTEYTNKANLLDNINNPNEFKLNSITVSDISDSDINTIVNTIKNKFLDELSKNRYSKETAIKEFKTLSGKLEGYLNNREQHRTYLTDNKNRIVTFYKTGPNMYEAANTLPKTMGDMQVLANVKTNGNVLNGNLTAPLNLTKYQANNVNNLISKLGLKGNFLTEKSSGRDVAELVKLNRNESKEILQALGADGLIEGKNKVRLYTAYDNLDNANPTGAIKNTITYLASEKAKNELAIRNNTTAPKNTNIKKEPSNLPELNETINVEKNAFDPENTTELNNIEAEEMFNDKFDEAWKQLKITDKKQVNKEEIKTWIKKMLFDRRVHINNVAIPNEDYNVRAALASLDAVASDAQVMIEGAQLRNNEIVGKPLKDIFNKLKGKKKKNDFQQYMMLELNIERENAGADKVFENLSKEQSRKKADALLKANPEFAEVKRDLERYNNILLDLLVDNGVINEKVANTLKNRYKSYMPLYSSDLSTFTNLTDNKYIKALNIDDTIKDVTKTGKKIQSLEKAMENKTYNVLSAIAKNKLAQEMSKSNHYQGDGKADLIFYVDGNVTKIKTSNDIISDINRDDVSHIVDMISEVPILKQMIDMNKLSYKFILDPVYQIKNLVIDFTDSQLVYSKDKKNFAKNYIRAAIAVANNSEVYNEFKEIGLGKIGEGWNAPNITYNEDGSINVKQNKFQRLYANLEAMPKLAEYLSLKDRYMKQARQDYEDGLYVKDGNHLKFNKDEKYALNHWSGTDSYIINEHFRYGTDITEDLQKISDSMDSILDKTQSESGTFNRSINLEGDKLTQFLNKYQKGKIVSEDAFTSIAKDIIYDDTMNVQMEIKTKYAKDLSSELRTNENERLLRRNSKFRVDDIEVSGGNNITVYRTNLTGGKKLEVPSMFGTGKYYGLDTRTQDMYERMYTNEGAKVNKTSETIDSSKLFDIEIEKNYKLVGADYYYDTKVAQILGNSIINNNIATKEEVNSILNNENTTRVEKMNKLNNLIKNKGYSGLLIKFEGNIEPNAKFSSDPKENKRIFNNSIFNNYGGNQVLIFDGQDVKPKEQTVKLKLTDVSEDTTLYKNNIDNKNTGVFEGKNFWSGSVNLLDGVIEEVHTYEEAENSDFHHREYFSETQSEKMDLGETAFFWIEDGQINGTWRDDIPLDIISKIKNQIDINDNNTSKDISFKDIQEKIKLKAKVEAQDVNLNFDSGGVASKALSKSGFKFLNAGMLGFDKFVTHVGEGVKTPKGMGRLLLEFTSIGATTAIANRILNGDDEEYDKLPYYYKNNYYMIKLGEDKWLRIPKGRVQTLYNVLFEYGTGIRTEDDAQTYIDSIKSAFELAVLPPALKESSPAAAIQQVFENKDAFGNPIYSEEYDNTQTKGQKILYHILSSYFGRYGRIIKDATDNDGTTDVMNEFDYYKDTTKANRHYQTVINLVDYYKKSDNVKTLDDKAMKKYVDTQNYALRTINSEISQGKKAGQTTDDLKMKYRARDDLLLQIINNHKDYTKEVDENGNTWYYFDDLTFMYNNKTGRFIKK